MGRTRMIGLLNKNIKLIQFIFGFIFIALYETIKLFIKRSRISLLSIFGLWVNFLSLPQENIVIQNHQIKKSLPNQKALRICGGDNSAIWFSAKREKFYIVLHARLMKTFPDWKAQMNYQKNKKSFINRLPIFNLILSEGTTLLLQLLDSLKSNPRPFSEHI